MASDEMLGDAMEVLLVFDESSDPEAEPLAEPLNEPEPLRPLVADGSVDGAPADDDEGSEELLEDWDDALPLTLDGDDDADDDVVEAGVSVLDVLELMLLSEDVDGDWVDEVEVDCA